PQSVSWLHLIERYVVFCSIVIEHTGGFGSEPQQSFDRAAGLTACTEFQYLPKQHQRRNHRGRLKVHRDHTAVHAERLWKELREERSDDTVAVGGSRPDGD